VDPVSLRHHAPKIENVSNEHKPSITTTAII
jgi:hypothetical protein